MATRAALKKKRARVKKFDEGNRKKPGGRRAFSFWESGGKQGKGDHVRAGGAALTLRRWVVKTILYIFFWFLQYISKNFLKKSLYKLRTLS